jgi:hypothetical protein
MGRVLAAVAAALVLCIGGLALAVYLTADEDNVAIDNLLSENFTRAVGLAEDPDEGANGIVDLRTLARFDGQTLVIVAPDTPDTAITRELGFPWTGIVGYETGPLLIFLRRDGSLARFADYRGNGRFAGIEQPFQRLPRDRTVFRVRQLVITVAR